MAWGDGIEKADKTKPAASAGDTLAALSAVVIFIVIVLSGCLKLYVEYRQYQYQRQLMAGIGKLMEAEAEKLKEHTERFTPAQHIGGTVEYPEFARERNLHGTAKIHVLIGAGGQVKDVKLAQTAGHEILDRYALKAAKNGMYLPATKGFERVEDIILVEFEF
ncbi:TPA: energy transducer TonB [Neisseria bacilliformis]|uniref:TonB domain protein n=1 Tax=Neisseria bacilliformis ATCC BAA-1200 TaxID=888742 RepID=F2BE04_9NEIS|nr:energy transducer TonB [Neisseria bacilliformis]EGF10323.1 TonB domain protein [Neisseria bacilliformis ATCC BAA-1200]QMT46708.1 energy transducer TonB [Neisseria bacilliformis]